MLAKFLVFCADCLSCGADLFDALADWVRPAPGPPLCSCGFPGPASEWVGHRIGRDVRMPVCPMGQTPYVDASL